MVGRAAHPGPSGVLVIDKAVAMTSFDVVARARRVLGERRIGHAGTLDPAASGVLPLLVGEATKLMPYLIDQDKEYLATLRLGITTDTHDLQGRIVATAQVPALDTARVASACQGLVGRIAQTPPMYSAVHHEGRRLYELAREGVEVARRAREVTVHAIEILELGETSVTLRVVCGKGTYVRVLAADLGAELGCGAAVERLLRVRVGPFILTTALAAEILVPGARSTLLARLLPVEAALVDWPAVDLPDRDAVAFIHGQHVPVPLGPAWAPLLRVRDSEGKFLGVGRSASGGTRVRPERIIHANRPGARDLPA